MKGLFDELPVVYLYPGEVYFSNEPALVTTILGSCLSITMFSKKLKYSAISHCQLPFFKSYNSTDVDCADPFKYVDCTIDKMLEAFEKIKIKLEEIEIKIFGGADVIGFKQNDAKSKTIGQQNISAAMKSINKHELSVSASDIGGNEGRKILFVTHTGEIFLKRLKSNEKN